jgi:SAM-dependent methyltransferase
MTMTSDRSTRWWRDSAGHFGFSVMDKTIRNRDDVDVLLASGRNDVKRALAVTGMRIGDDLACLEIGCGVGRLTFALADAFGFVLGTDVSQALLDRATAINWRNHVVFELSDGIHLRPRSASALDVVFSCEVFHHLERTTIANYVQDAYGLLRAGGQFVFQVNVTPLHPLTRLAALIRRTLHACGKSSWRGFPTTPGFARKHHTVSFIRDCLAAAGFQLDRVLDEDPGQTWFVASKPQCMSTVTASAGSSNGPGQ